MAKVECVVNADGKLGLGEGPHWDHKNQRLLWLEIFQRFDETKGKMLHIYDPNCASVSDFFLIQGDRVHLNIF